MDGRRRTIGSAVLVLAIAFLTISFLAACSGSAATPAAVPDAGAPAPAPPERPGTGDGGTAAPVNTSDGTAGALIVRTGELQLQVGDVASVLPKARDAVASLGGYVAGSDEQIQAKRRIAKIVYRIPVERWQETLDALRGLADEVLTESTRAEEVTSQVVDINARLVNLRASEASLRDIMARAGTIPDVLAVQEKLASVRQEIEQLVAQQADLTGRAALATLAVSWMSPVVAVEAAQSGWDLGREIDHAAAQTVRAGQAVASALVWIVIVGVPVLGPMVLLGAIGLLLYRRWTRGRPPRDRQTGWTPLPPAGTPPAGPASG